MKAVRIKINGLYAPSEADGKNITVSWNCEGGKSQTAYRVTACDSLGKTLFDSGKVNSGSMNVKFTGNPVPCETKAYVKVTLWDESGEPGEPSETFFTTGLPEDRPWDAKWITGNYRPDRNRRYPADCFRKKFTAGKVKKAVLYITACGIYTAKINGQKCGKPVLAPGITDYRKRVQYKSYDVTELIKSGENTVEATLGDGWYRGSVGAWGVRNAYGTVTKLIAMLKLTCEDGKVTTVSTDNTWDWSSDGPVRFCDNKDGEIYDSRMEPSYSGKAKLTRCNVIPTASGNEDIEEHEQFSAVKITTPKGKTVLDFGQNIAGYVKFSLPAKAGQKLTMRFGEYIAKDGEFTQKNIQCVSKKKTTPLQKVEYICREGMNDYKTCFAIFGFRYIEVESDFEIDPAWFTALTVYSSLEETGSFECSNELLTKFYKNTVWSAKGNFCDIPTDCPTRERHGWSGDAQIFCKTACYLFDFRPFAEKYLNDLYDWQKKNGCLPQIAPEGGTDFYMKVMNGSVGWADAGIIIPYVLWKQYGDMSVLEKYIGGMRKYAAFQMGRCGKKYVLHEKTGLRGEDAKYINLGGPAYGEWAEPDDVHHMTWKDCAWAFAEVPTAYTAYITSLMAEMEEALGNRENAAKYRDFSEKVKKSYRALLGQPGFSLDTDRQARLVRPLALGLIDKDQADFAKKRLIKALENYGWRLGTGFLSTPLILDVLKDIDIKYAYRLLENEEMPGWLFMPKNGATTVWEAWEGTESPNGGIASLNHYSKGACVKFLFDTVCGIKVSGENRFTVAPLPGGSLTYAKASYTSVYGKISCGWEKKGGKTVYTLTVPSGTTADVTLSGGTSRQCAPGTYIFEE